MFWELCSRRSLRRPFASFKVSVKASVNVSLFVFWELRSLRSLRRPFAPFRASSKEGGLELKEANQLIQCVDFANQFRKSHDVCSVQCNGVTF